MDQQLLKGIWLEVDDPPMVGEEVLVRNSVRKWYTKWNPALCGEEAQRRYPVTHYFRVPDTVPCTEPDMTSIFDEELRHWIRMKK